MLKKVILSVLFVVGLIATGRLVIGWMSQHRQVLKSCFDNAQGLRAGAPVRLAGVDVGTIRSVRVQPQNKSCPAEVEMRLATPYELPVPKEASTQVETARVLGESYVSIDGKYATGPRIEQYGYLKSLPTGPQPTLEETIRTIVESARPSNPAPASREAAPSSHHPRKQ